MALSLYSFEIGDRLPEHLDMHLPLSNFLYLTKFLDGDALQIGSLIGNLDEMKPLNLASETPVELHRKSRKILFKEDSQWFETSNGRRREHLFCAPAAHETSMDRISIEDFKLAVYDSAGAQDWLTSCGKAPVFLVAGIRVAAKPESDEQGPASTHTVTDVEPPQSGSPVKTDFDGKIYAVRLVQARAMQDGAPGVELKEYWQ
ncbi:hypothetical protein V2A60_008847 [Cordyceps javanica]|uniref:Uncharacterized protein n=1 Tax=Cordyceps javanica TaxID=43265 RepID=A0A545UPX4_9HYPO|nr:hypothetical protein IF1G_10015 [Cordyceps javanica]TQW03078.1 hypothetical protein IF2G_09211 [Cordyceps javanica]